VGGIIFGSFKFRNAIVASRTSYCEIADTIDIADEFMHIVCVRLLMRIDAHEIMKTTNDDGSISDAGTKCITYTSIEHVQVCRAVSRLGTRIHTPSPNSNAKKEKAQINTVCSIALSNQTMNTSRTRQEGFIRHTSVSAFNAPSSIYKSRKECVIPQSPIETSSFAHPIAHPKGTLLPRTNTRCF